MTDRRAARALVFRSFVNYVPPAPTLRERLGFLAGGLLRAWAVKSGGDDDPPGRGRLLVVPGGRHCRRRSGRHARRCPPRSGSPRSARAAPPGPRLRRNQPYPPELRERAVRMVVEVTPNYD